MLILIIGIVAFIIVCFVINLIDKNKEKLATKFKMQKIEIMKCPNCLEEYTDLSLEVCKHCNSSLEKKTKYKVSKEFKKKLCCIVVSLILIILVLIGIYTYVNNYIKTKQKLDKYNSDINLCYELIKDNSDWNEFKQIIDSHNLESNFEPDAYEKLYQAIDERIENIKNGNNDDALLTMLTTIENDFSSETTANTILQKIEEKYLIANSYSNINKASRDIEEQNYKEAFDLLTTVINDNKDKNQEIVDIATNKQNEIKDKAFEQIIAQAQEQLNNKEYTKAQSLLKSYKDLENQTISDMYNNATNEVNRIEAEKKAQEEAERKAQQEEERKRQQAELDAKKDQLTINKNGKKIWKVCMTSNTFRFQATYRGSGNFIVKLLDSNQDLEELIVNEIGDYNVDKTVRVKKGEYYYIETFVSDGSWNGTWWGTYGD